MHFPRWLAGIAFGLFVTILILLPLVLVLLRKPWVSEFLPSVLRTSSDTTSTSYSVRSDVPDHAMQLFSTRYLDYVTGKFGIFDENGVVDPQLYITPGSSERRQTVSRVQFLLVPRVDIPLLSFSGENTFVGMGDYQIDRDTLIIRVYLDISELTKGKTAQKYALEHMYLKTAFVILAFAKGLPAGSMKAQATVEIEQDMQKNLDSGLFVWPIRIEQV